MIVSPSSARISPRRLKRFVTKYSMASAGAWMAARTALGARTVVPCLVMYAMLLQALHTRCEVEVAVPVVDEFGAVAGRLVELVAVDVLDDVLGRVGLEDVVPEVVPAE